MNSQTTLSVFLSFKLAILAMCGTAMCGAVMCGPAFAQTLPLQEQSQTPPDLMAMEGKVIELIYADGVAEWPLTVVEVEAGKEEGTVKSIKVQFKDEKRRRKINANKIAEILIEHQPLDVAYDKKSRALVHDPEERKERLESQKTVSDRLRGKRDRFWGPLTEDQEEAFLAKQEALIEKTQSHFSRLKFRVIETEYFHVCTDLTAQQVDGYLASLDEMYRQLCMAFGIPPARKIWCGKCVVFAFSREADFHEFEASIMNNADSRGAQGLCHQSGNGNVVFAGYRGKSDAYFGTVLVHETAHGFVHRYLSSARAPSWLNEGMSDWIANAIMKTNDVPRKQVSSANHIRKAGTWGDFLTTDRIGFEYYGAASTLVEILLRRDKGGQFREFFRGIKEGKAADESLKDSFGLSYEDLKILYAEQLQRMPR